MSIDLHERLENIRITALKKAHEDYASAFRCKFASEYQAVLAHGTKVRWQPVTKVDQPLRHLIPTH